MWIPTLSFRCTFSYSTTNNRVKPKTSLRIKRVDDRRRRYFQMKKRVTAILTVLMVLAMSTSVFAASSPTSKSDPVQPSKQTSTATEATTTTPEATTTTPAQSSQKTNTAAKSSTTTTPVNTVSGLTVSAATAANLPAGAALSGDQLTSGATYDAAAAIAKANISGLVDFAVFNINVTSGATVIHQLDGYVQVSLPVPANLTIPAGKTIVVYRVEDNGSLTKCDTTVANGTVTFSTNHFSTYIFAVTDASKATSATSPKTGETSAMPILFAAALAACAGAGYTMKKRA
jgi:cobalamin biosynthesis Mg chelatase CobN